MKKTEQELYLTRYWNVRKAFINRKREEAGEAFKPLTKSDFERQILSTLDPKGTGKTINDFSKDKIKAAARKNTSTILYLSKEEMFHRGAVEKLKEQGLLSRIYRQGGSTAMENTTFTSKKDVMLHKGDAYTSYGTYNFGGVDVIFYEPTDSQNPFLVSIGGKLY